MSDIADIKNDVMPTYASIQEGNNLAQGGNHLILNGGTHLAIKEETVRYLRWKLSGDQGKLSEIHRGYHLAFIKETI